MDASSRYNGRVRPPVHHHVVARFHTSTTVVSVIFLFAAIAITSRTAAASPTGSAPAAAPTSDRCTKCRLDYVPVVDVSSGLFFYNECLARCQLGRDVKLAAAADSSGLAFRRTEGSSAILGGSGAKTPDFSRLIPEPAATVAKTTAKQGVGAAPANTPPPPATVWVTSEAMTRFSDDGFVYVGRPGFLDRKSTALEKPDQQRQASQRPGKDKAAGGANTFTSGAGPTVSLRMTYPDGDMYMKVWSSGELKTMVGKYTDPSSPAAAWAVASSSSTTTNTNSVGNNSTDNTDTISNSSSSSAPSRRRLMTTMHRHLLTHANNAIKGRDDRYEITSVSYPYTAVAYFSFSNSYACSSSLIGSTGRLVLTAAHCLFNWDYNQRRALGWYNNFWVAPGHNRGNVAPYGWHYGGIAEVLTVYTQSGDWSSDIGLMQLQYHYKNPGSLGYTYTCGRSSYSLISAGYPGDKPHGTLWYQRTSVTTDVCSGAAETRWYFDSAQGQSGSSFWTSSDNYVRFVLSNSSPDTNGAVAITPSHYSWISKFTDNYIATTPPRILVGGGNRDLFVRCDTNTWRCVGTGSRTSATRFYAYPIGSTNKFALAVPGTKLCLNLWGGGNSGSVNLYGCNSNNNYVFAGNELWNTVSSGIPTVRSDSGGYLWWDGGERQMLAISACPWAWQCMWRLESP